MWKFIRRVIVLVLLVIVILAVGMVRYGWKPLGEGVDYDALLGLLPDSLTGRIAEPAAEGTKATEFSVPKDTPTKEEREALDRLLEEKGG